MANDMQAMIFDMDGVIFDSERAVIACWKTVAARHGIENIEDHCIQALGLNEKATRELFERQYGIGMPYEALRLERKALFLDMFDRGKVDVKPGVRELLNYLRSKGIKTAIASSTSTPTVRRELEAAGLLDLFDVIIGGDQVKRSKPDPDIWLKALESLGLKAGECAAVEDSVNGVTSAKAAGLFTFMVPDLLLPDDNMRRLADEILPTLNDVLEYIKRGDLL